MVLHRPSWIGEVAGSGSALDVREKTKLDVREKTKFTNDGVEEAPPLW